MSTLGPRIFSFFRRSTSLHPWTHSVAMRAYSVSEMWTVKPAPYSLTTRHCIFSISSELDHMEDGAAQIFSRPFSVL